MKYHKLKKLRTKSKPDTYLIYCKKKDDWAVIPASGFRDAPWGTGFERHWHCPFCKDIIWG